jgi:hypothetical protein
MTLRKRRDAARQTLALRGPPSISQGPTLVNPHHTRIGSHQVLALTDSQGTDVRNARFRFVPFE